MSYPEIVLSMTIWAFLFTLLFLSPKFGLGVIWKEKIRDFDKATTGLGAFVFGVTFLVACLGSVLALMFPIRATTEWWHGLVAGGAIGAGISVVTLAVTGIHRLLYDKFITQSEPESWPLTFLRCSFYMILITVAGLIMTASR